MAKEVSSLQEALQKLEKKHGKGTVRKLATGEAFVPVDVIPTGVYSIDRALGVGGFARGRVAEVFGDEASGKTTLVLHAIVECQKMGLIAAYIDVENALDMKYAESLGVDLTKLLFSQPSSAEEALDIAQTLAKTGEVAMVVVDSVASLVPMAENDSDPGKSQIGSIARFMSQSLRQVVPDFNKTNTALIFINQLRTSIGVMFGDPMNTPGGVALKYAASQRVDLRRSSKVLDSDGNPNGHVARIKVVKSKVSSPGGATRVPVIFGRGFDKDYDVFTMALEKGVIYKEGGTTLFFKNEKLGVGENRAYAKLLTEKRIGEVREELDKMFDSVDKILKERKEEEAHEESENEELE